MAISTDVVSVTYQGDGNNTAFPFSTIFPNDVVYVQDIEVQNYIKCKVVAADGTETVLTGDYFVDVPNRTLYYPGYAPGTDSPDPPPKLTATEHIVIYRDIPVTQLSDLGKKWPFAVIEAGLDKLTMIIQDKDELIGTALSDISSSGNVLTFTKIDGSTESVTTQDTTYTITTGSTPGTIAVNGVDVAVDGLSTVATTGDYDDLIGAPSLATVATTGSYDDLTDTPVFATVATSGSYTDLTNKPTIPVVPTDISAFTNDVGYITGVAWGDVTGKPAFATVATTGDYDDLTDKPTIPVVPTDVSAFTNDAGYITSSDSITGNAATATLATTATTATTANGLSHTLTINSTPFDGTSDVDITIGGGGVTELTAQEVDDIWDDVWN